MLKKDYSSSYVVAISAYTEVYEDDYNYGERDYVNAFCTDKQGINVGALDEENILIIKQFVLDYINEMLFDELTMDNLAEQVLICDERIDYAQQCNENNYEPSKTEIKLWKEGKCKLYTQDISLHMTINGIAVSEEDLNTIIEYKEAK